MALEGFWCEFKRESDGVVHAARSLPTVPRVGEYVLTIDDILWKVKSVTYVLGPDDLEKVGLVVCKT